jgi:hypothetical protein
MLVRVSAVPPREVHKHPKPNRRKIEPINVELRKHGSASKQKPGKTHTHNAQEGNEPYISLRTR